MLHLRKDECVGAGAVLHMVLLTLECDPCGQQVGQVEKGKGQEMAHVLARDKQQKQVGGERRFYYLVRWLSLTSFLPVVLLLKFPPTLLNLSFALLSSDFNSCCSSLSFITFASPYLASLCVWFCIQSLLGVNLSSYYFV